MPEMSSTTPFFGRQDELAALNNALDDPQGKAILVVDPQGMGKSALIDYFFQKVENGETHPLLHPCVTMSFHLTKE